MVSQIILTTVTLVPGEGPEDLMAKYNKAMEEMDTTNGVIILNDLFGGSLIMLHAVWLWKMINAVL